MRPSLVARSPFFAADARPLTRNHSRPSRLAVGLDQGLLAVHHAGACVLCCVAQWRAVAATATRCRLEGGTATGASRRPV